MTIEEFARKVEEGEIAGLRRAKLDCEANLNNAKTTIKPGKRWTKVDVGSSGRYMVDMDGSIYGIKAYGVPHFGHPFGTLENPNPRCFQGRY
ncbi:MAG: hypothetical protein Q7T04_02330 [Dehalococcoidia bacterium]|nr:hypothetical protein [Dehalococcoidia bacterium]